MGKEGLEPPTFSSQRIIAVNVSLFLEQDTRFELALHAWKARVLAANTNPAYTSRKNFKGLEPFLFNYQILKIYPI